MHTNISIRGSNIKFLNIDVSKKRGHINTNQMKFGKQQHNCFACKTNSAHTHTSIRRNVEANLVNNVPNV